MKRKTVVNSIPLQMHWQSSQQQSSQKHIWMESSTRNQGHWLAKGYTVYNSAEKIYQLVKAKNKLKMWGKMNIGKVQSNKKENLIEKPNFTIGSWFWHTMPIVMKQNPLRFGISTTCIAKFLYFLYSRIKLNFIPSLFTSQKVNWNWTQYGYIYY